MFIKRITNYTRETLVSIFILTSLVAGFRWFGFDSEGFYLLIGVLISPLLLSVPSSIKNKQDARNKLRALITELSFNESAIIDAINLNFGNHLLPEDQPYIAYAKENLKTTIFQNMYSSDYFINLDTNIQSDLYSTYHRIDLLKKSIGNSWQDLNLPELKTDIQSTIRQIKEMLNIKNQ